MSSASYDAFKGNPPTVEIQLEKTYTGLYNIVMFYSFIGYFSPFRLVLFLRGSHLSSPWRELQSPQSHGRLNNHTECITTVTWLTFYFPDLSYHRDLLWQTMTWPGFPTFYDAANCQNGNTVEWHMAGRTLHMLPGSGALQRREGRSRIHKNLITFVTRGYILLL